MIDAGARIAELIRENLVLHSKLAKHGLPPPACKLAALKEFFFIPWRGAAGFDRRAGWHPR